MLKRKITTYIETHLTSNSDKILLIEGARQVGKSYAIREAGKRLFDNYVEINFVTDNESEQLFMHVHNIDEFYLRLSSVAGDKLGQYNNTLIFIDEIQNSPKAVALLRYFYEDYPWLHVIAAGSLLLTLLDQHISFPVGRVQYMHLHPCSFSDFLEATGNTLMVNELEKLQITSDMHPMLMSLFSEFALIGGMPEAIARYAEKQDVVALRDVYSSLLRSYSEDVEKYAKNDTMKNVIRLLLKKGWTYSTEQITLGNFAESSYKAREMGEALRTLERTYLLELTYPITTYQLPMIQENRRKPKLFWLDMGLINYVANIQQEVMSSVNIMDAWRGKLAEQIVAQELLSNTTDADAHRDFWVRNKNNATSELDFVYVYQGQIIPVEVKAGHNSHLRSLQIFMDEAPTNIALRVWNQPMQIDELQTPKGKSFRLLSIPFYYVHLLNQILQMLDVIE